MFSEASLESQQAISGVINSKLRFFCGSQRFFRRRIGMKYKEKLRFQLKLAVPSNKVIEHVG